MTIPLYSIGYLLLPMLMLESNLLGSLSANGGDYD